MSTICSIQDTGVGTSNSCSASCVTRTAARSGTTLSKILGTSITCSATRTSRGERTPRSNCSTTSGTGTSKVGSNGASTIWSTVCRWTRTCGRGSVTGRGRAPTLVLVTVSWSLGKSYAVPTLECEWWVTVASTATTVCCSCRHHERRRRCLRRHEAPDARSTSMSTARVFLCRSPKKKKGTLESDACGGCGGCGGSGCGCGGCGGCGCGGCGGCGFCQGVCVDIHNTQRHASVLHELCPTCRLPCTVNNEAWDHACLLSSRCQVELLFRMSGHHKPHGEYGSQSSERNLMQRLGIGCPGTIPG